MTIKEIINNPETKFVDVRTSMEYTMGHVNGSVNIPLDQFQHRYTEIENLGTKPVVFYCRSGNRSGQAVAWLQQMGYSNIYNGGGLEDVQFYLT